MIIDLISIKRLLIVVVTIAVILPTSALAVTILDQEAENSIKQNCVDAQQSMQTLQRADAVTRINRGNSYATIQKLMTSMSARAAANAYNIPELTEITRDFTEQKDAFVGQYTEYEIALRNLSSMDCETDPVLFYDRLQSVREQRQDLGQKVNDMQQQIKLFDQAVVKLKSEVEGRDSSAE